MPFRWPWQRMEKRESGGDLADYTDAVTRLVEAQAAGQSAADAGRSAAVEVAAGSLSRALAAADVDAEPFARAAVTPAYLAQVGRDLIRKGESLHVIRGHGGTLRLDPSAAWNYESSGPDPASWTIRCTTYGPSEGRTESLPASAIVHAKWGSDSGTPYRGSGPVSYAAGTGRLLAELERSLADESAGPVANLLPVPDTGTSDGAGTDTGTGAGTGDGTAGADPQEGLRADIRNARGRALLLETVSAGWDIGRDAAPRRDWIPARLGPNPPAPLVDIWREAYGQTLAAAGLPVALTAGNADGTAQREAFRRYLTLTVQPVGTLLSAELSAKLETPVRLSFAELYAHDLVGRASAYKSLRDAGMEDSEARRIAGL